jgi:hypothetical protein
VLARGQATRPGQSAGTETPIFCPGSEHVIDPRATVVDASSERPRGGQGGGQPKAKIVGLPTGPREGGSKVGVVVLQAIEDPGRVPAAQLGICSERDLEVVLGVAAPAALDSAVGRKPRLSALAHRFQEPVAHSASRCRLRDHQGVVDQQRQAVEHVVSGGDGLGCLDVEALRERRQLLEEQLLGGFEELVAPRHRVVHGQVSRIGIAERALQQGARGIEPIDDLRGREHPTPCGHQLDGKG